MEYMTLAQAVGDQPIPDAGWGTNEIDEYFGGDMDEAREHIAYERKEKIAELESQLAQYQALYGDL